MARLRYEPKPNHRVPEPGVVFYFESEQLSAFLVEELMDWQMSFRKRRKLQKWFAERYTTFRHYLLEEHATVVSFEAWLETIRQQPGRETLPMELPSRLYSAILKRQFAAFDCPQCRASYGAGNGSTSGWSIGEELAAEGGKRFCCPYGHVLYAVKMWNS